MAHETRNMFHHSFIHSCLKSMLPKQLILTGKQNKINKKSKDQDIAKMDRNLPRRMSSANPFASLFRGTSQDHSDPPEPTLNDQLEKIFSFTLNEKATLTKEILFLEETHKELDTTILNIDNLDQALYDRLFMCQNDNEVLKKNKRLAFRNPHAIEVQPIKYLYKSYVLLHANIHLKAEHRLLLKDKIIQSVATSIFQPDIFPDQDLEQQMIDLLKEGGAQHDTFFVEVARRMLDEENNDDIVLTSFIDQMNRKVTAELRKSSLVNIDYSLFNYFNVFTANDYLAEIFMDCCVPFELHKGSEYANTPIGALFDLSVLPKDVKTQPYEHFTSPMDQAGNQRVEGLLWQSLDKLNEHVHQFLLTLLKRNTIVKNKVLTWVGGCLKYNLERGKLWNMHQQSPQATFPNESNSPVSDGFMLNFCSIMLRLCRPFCSNFKDNKILKVDPTYPAVPTVNDALAAASKGIHMYGLSSETCFIPVESIDGLEETRKTAEKYNFITESFFMAHKSIDLSYRVAVDQMLNLNHEIGRLEKAYKDAMQQVGSNSEVVTALNKRLMAEYTKFFSLKCVLSEPNLLKDMFDFMSATCYWLCQLVMKTEFPENETATFAPLEERPIVFPLPTKIPFTLKCIPEFLVENIVSYLVFLRRYSLRTFEEVGYEKMEPVLTFLLVFMGSKDHMKNPHIRARLAEGLESLLPHHKDEMMPDCGGYQRQLIFTHHPHKLEIVKMLMNVFVGIEMTGQSVEFEQKFKYRRPMYAVFDYLWELPDHTECFKTLAVEAEANMEAVHPPLFLRFVNLLINDAIFLLDESLTNMAKLKEMQTAYDSGEWDKLGFQERAQNISYLHHIGLMARFDNILGRDTISTLEKLTSKITSVFTHPTMVDRVASMLNYFLLNLVGPNRKNFKAKNLEEYAFDPKGTVLQIIKIYINLKENDEFCLAISQDGRSYSPELFQLAEDVLIKVGGGPLLGEIKDIAEKVARKAEEHKANEEAMAEAPEHFLDPIMSTLMTDPVQLPSSKQIVDRTTIARHLLSDQSDPFNRSPLSMDQVIPQTELKAEIEKWVQERKRRVMTETQ
ncbi:ubiquitin conjugation factor E4 A [Anthonomus grandis grandis]|uniref:ubiquitin conjugation factor E4 A n=1 Tax=Anthonomus grandis grandis TaxID=2921223 RepID=UPI0021656C23|nr:ubiquitin conjugation factor E4 A [Anthonomus grandis grandis]